MDRKDLSLVHTSTFSAASFSLIIFICSCTWGKLPEFFVTNEFAEKLAPQFLCGEEINVIREGLFVCTTRHRKLVTYSEVGSGFFCFVPTVHCRFLRIGKRVFNIAFDVFIHEQISLSQKTCHRKRATENLLVCTRLQCPCTKF